MPKAHAHTPGRKPPVPSDSHAVVADWMAGTMPALQPIVEHVDRAIRDAIPGLQYAVKWKKAYYGLPGKGWLMEMVAYDVSVNLVFFAGAKFDPAPPLGEGSRYVKIRSLDEARAPEVRDWIGQATKHPGWR
ncbi:hypothetical protein L599_001500000340 [Luteimonas sp. J16]|uniref:DUF1801 domain-containing protein n=1 Tax=unclassified Luteimonas TaxID=2629088 RepID=UPI00047D1293|nr:MULTISPECIES: DUF1801 domain-containing protein [unclassified Luteimonas]TWG93155.1 hypothetical protein L599_001500000340 [Luteimonas sp. J16]